MKYLCVIFLFLPSAGFCQEDKNAFKKELRVTKTEESIKIDGILDEDFWKTSNIANKFIALRPNPRQDLPEKTEVRVTYDDNAIYIGAKLIDSRPDSIFKQFVERDNIGASDFFGISSTLYSPNTFTGLAINV